ncbi:MAG: hypothetical protein DRP74_02375 [Candidatus Omnitrophota bacterium]|nr:MAG: hypothetical protein DRP74_02375 [Candidatus Omnitrophota bacterium]
MLKKISILIVVLHSFFRGVVYAAEPTIRTVSDKKEVGIGEKLKVTVEMEWKQDEEHSIIVEKITPPSSSLLERIGSKENVSSRLGEGGVFAKRNIEYVYIAKEKGLGDITPIVIEYARSDNRDDKKIIRGESVTIEVISKAARFAKIALKSFYALLAIGTLSGILILLKRKFIISRGHEENKSGNDKGILERQFCENLKELNKHKVSGDLGGFYSGIEKLISDYIKEKYNSDLSAESISKLPGELQKIFSECKYMVEKVRFSGYKPERNEEDRLVRGIARYMKSLIPGENEEESIETIGPVRDKAP